MIDPGWLGVILLMIAPTFQIYRLIKYQTIGNVSLLTYLAVVVGVVCYLIHALMIHDLVFTISNGVNLMLNGTVLVILLKRHSSAKK